MGMITVRLPDTKHEGIKLAAEDAGLSMNTWCVQKLCQAAGKFVPPEPQEIILEGGPLHNTLHQTEDIVTHLVLDEPDHLYQLRADEIAKISPVPPLRNQYTYKRSGERKHRYPAEGTRVLTPIFKFISVNVITNDADLSPQSSEQDSLR